MYKAKKDILGYIYQNIKSESSKKEMGQYFTPKKAVDFIINNIDMDFEENKKLKVLDPACGSGQFLLSAYNNLLEQYNESKQLLNQLPNYYLIKISYKDD